MHTKYTVVDTNGAGIERGCTKAEAAALVLSYDSAEWDLRPMTDPPKSAGFAGACYNNNTAAELRAALAGNPDASECEDWDLTPEEWRAEIEAAVTALETVTGWELWTRKECANQKWSKTVVFSLARDRAAAESEIFDEVIRADWRGHPAVQTDAEYNANLARVLADTEAKL